MGNNGGIFSHCDFQFKGFTSKIGFKKDALIPCRAKFKEKKGKIWELFFIYFI